VKTLLKTLALATVVSCFAVPSTVGAAGPIHFKTQLNGVNEVLPNATRGTGELTATISADRLSITYTLTYSNLEGTNGVGNNRLLFAHFHFGLPREAAGVMVFLCNNTGVAPGGVPPCPDDGTGSGTVRGTITAADVVGPKSQGILQEGTTNGGGATETAADAFGEVLKAIEEGASYTNVHTQTFMGGEIRGQNRNSED
jgi:CHRD domain-containing protein